MTRCDRTEAWAALAGHYEAHGRGFDLREAFARDPQRFERFALQAPEVFADLSKGLWDEHTRRLLLELAREPGVVVSKSLLSQRLDPLGEPVDFGAIEVHVSNLRRKIGAELIRTVRGVGYLLQP